MEAGNFSTNRSNLFPNAEARMWAEGCEYFGSCRAKNICNLPWFQKEIHRVHNAAGLTTQQQKVCLGNIGEQQRDHIIRSNAEVLEQIGGLMDTSKELLVGDAYANVVGVCIGKIVQCCLPWIRESRLANHRIGAVREGTLLQRDSLERLNIGKRVNAQAG